MKIEDLRGNELGNIGFVIKKSNYKGVVWFQHHEIVNELMIDVLKYLTALENPPNNMIFSNNIECLKLVSITFICLECYVNDVFKLICNNDKNAFMRYRGKSLDARLKLIIKTARYSNVEQNEFYKCGCFQCLREFEEYRNIVFHGGFYEEKTFRKTLFSENPLNCNVVDVLQALKILVDIFTCFRFIVVDKDIMPQSVINYGGKMYFEKVDITYARVIVPMFGHILKKHAVESDLEPSLSDFSFKSTTLLQPKDVLFCVQCKQQGSQLEPSWERSNYMSELMNKLTENVIIDKEHFRIPNYNKM
ncbi:MAG: hypothetical protein Q4D07_07095 [Selenomonadaceae bacterium]|nr:hypothetical protein [Selenomonadaceae bacterium]